MPTVLRVLVLSATAMSFAAMCGAAENPAGARAAAPVAEVAPVFTRARVASMKDDANGMLQVRLKLLPRAKLPFTTQTFTVTDRASLAGVQEGSWVKFTSRHIDGQNTVTSIHVVAECRRFQPCD